MVVASPGCTMTGSGGMGVRFREGTLFAATVVVLPGESLGEEEEDEEVNLGCLEEAEDEDDDLVLS